jgi:hypothetical protein
VTNHKAYFFVGKAFDHCGRNADSTLRMIYESTLCLKVCVGKNEKANTLRRNLKAVTAADKDRAKV